jgi:hypothetical protein
LLAPDEGGWASLPGFSTRPVQRSAIAWRPSRSFAPKRLASIPRGSLSIIFALRKAVSPRRLCFWRKWQAARQESGSAPASLLSRSKIRSGSRRTRPCWTCFLAGDLNWASAPAALRRRSSLSASTAHGSVFDRHLATVRDALAGKRLGSEDTLYPPAPQLVDRMWQATFSVGGGIRAGKAGDGLMLSRTQPRTREAPHASLADLQHPIIDAYLAALPPDREPRILGSRTLFVADNRDEALAFADIGLRRIVDHFVSAGHIVSGRSLEELIATFDVHIGTPDDVIASLRSDSTLERVTDLVFQVHSVDPPHPYTLRSLELIAKEVAPALGWERQNVGRTSRISLAH